jgi:DNA-binding HxlR family transcriptional regulator
MGRIVKYILQGVILTNLKPVVDAMCKWGTRHQQEKASQRLVTAAAAFPGAKQTRRAM